MESGSILFCGVGGQGILLASEITAIALIGAGFDVKKSEVHGMAQRGGSVVAHLRFGRKVYSPLIEPGTADIEVAFELLESVRHLEYLNGNSKVVVNTQRIPPPSVTSGDARYPEGVLDELVNRGIETFPVDAFGIARKAGELRTVNMVLVGALSNLVPVSEDDFLSVIGSKVKKGFVRVNKEAFRMGRALTLKMTARKLRRRAG